MKEQSTASEFLTAGSRKQIEGEKKKLISLADEGFGTKTETKMITS